MMAPGERLAWLDVAKGIGMLLVVTGHVLLGSDASYAKPLTTAIYAFHMPMFFLLAGFTLKLEAPRDFALRKIVMLGLPYLTFLGALGIPALMLSCGLGASLPAIGIDRCSVLAFKLLSGGSMLGGIFGTFWFVPCLLGGLVIAQLVLSARSEIVPASAFAFLVGAAYLLPAQLPWSTGVLSLGSAPMAAVLVLVGHGLAQSNLVHNKRVLAGFGVIGLGVLAAGTTLDFKFAVFGVPILSMAGAVALSCLALGLSNSIASLPVLARSLRFVGQRTLAVLYLHQAIHLSLRLVGVQSDLVLIMLSLAVPLVLHRVIDQPLFFLTHRKPFYLSRKSPSFERTLK